MMTTGARRIEVDGDAFGAQHLDQLVMDDLDDHLAGLDRLQHLGADGLLAHLVGEGAHDVQRHVGLEQRTAHLAQRRRDIGLRQRAAAGQAVQDGAKAFLEDFKHLIFLSVSGWCPRGNRSRSVVDEAQDAKPKSTRGRIALPGVDLRDLFIALASKRLRRPGRLARRDTRRGIRGV